ncbi:MAG TPA: EAL domain-containing protein [Solirubrobacteraceae bacterium]|nr:EAL domain-containing protein [Solirubrobacteraceae bacterium]
MLSLLVVEDSAAYATLVDAMLRQALGGALSVHAAASLAEARSALRSHNIDCVLLDLSLPDAHGLQALEVVQALSPSVPVIVLTGNEDEELAISALQQGAQDFIAKRRADGELLVRCMRYAIERKRSELRLSHQALHDALTGLPNRMLLLDRLESALARYHRQRRALALMFIDLDRFKTINDSLGHEAGDELLVALAGRLRRMVRPSDTVARFGGDEFVILCEELHGQDEAIHVAERARSVLSAPIVLRGREIAVDASIGIAFGGPEVSAEALLRHADSAMYRAKREGSGIALFEAALHEAALAALELEHALRGALERGELELHYQPVVQVGERPQLFALEALLRWRHSGRGLLAPEEFVPIAEETGMIVPIGAWVLREGARQLSEWIKTGVLPPSTLLSVNLSGAQLASQAARRALEETLAESGLPARNICLEVTETSIAGDERATVRALSQLRELGVSLALDDFGTGYSSLSMLRSLPVQAVKIDRAFLRQAADDEDLARMFGAVLGVVHAASLHAVAEGVESKAQLSLVRAAGCELVQGFLFARALSAAELPRRVSKLVGGGEASR